MPTTLFRLLFIGLLFASYVPVTAQQPTTQPRPPQKSKPYLRVLAEYERTKDPATNQVPYTALEQARVSVKNRLATSVAIPGVTWTERGPNNIGGRVRALQFDPQDATNKKVWTGGVSGGLWYNNDITLSSSAWVKVNDFWDNLAITCIDYDPSKPYIRYVGTGEGFYNIDAVGGGGIWKTTDSGATWNKLTSTTPDFSNTATTIPAAFRYINDLVVMEDGTVVVGANGGILRSTDGGTSWARTNTSIIRDLERTADGILLAGTADGKILKSTDNGNTWTNITPTIVTGGGRTEIGIALSTQGASQVIYASAAGSSNHTWFIKSTDGGTSWTSLTVPNFTQSQGWYDFIIQVHPSNPDIVVAGGTNFVRSVNGGSTWSSHNYGSFGHPDMHAIAFRPGNTDQAIYGSDGGVYFCTDFGNASAAFPSSNTSARNNNLNITQFYSVATKNVSGSNYYLAGAQDNGNIKVDAAGLSAGAMVQGGDGMLSFIDQDNPAIQITGYQYNEYVLRDANGVRITTIVPDSDGKFINPADYDSERNIFYSYKSYGSDTKLSRVTNVGTTNNYSVLTLPQPLNVSFIKVAKQPNTLLIGTTDAKVYLVQNLDVTPTVTQINTGSGMIGQVSCIEVGAFDEHLIVTLSNYNVKSVWYTENGSTWVSKDEASYGLPNIPVRFALFNPVNRKQVMLATELGVWSTNDITAANPGWEISSTSLAHVRSDMLRYRQADKQVVVGTHGRGIFTSNVFSAGCAVVAQPTASNVTVCNSSSTATLTASGCSGTYTWFDTGLNGTALGTGSSFTTPPIIANTTYWVSCTVGSCTSDRTAVKVALYNPSQVPTAAGKTICAPPVSTTLIASGCDIGYQWFSTASGGTSIATGSTFSTPALSASTTYYVACSSSCGTSARTAVPVTVNPACPICIPATTDCSDGDVITGIIIKYGTTDLLNTTAVTPTCSPNGYSYNTTPTVLAAGRSYEITVNNVGVYNEGMRVWIDYNANGVFEASEIVAQKSVGVWTTYTATFTVPTTLAALETRMRIRLMYDNLPDPCSNASGFGETEDYAIQLGYPCNATSAAVTYPIGTQAAGEYKAKDSIESRAAVGTPTLYQAGKYIQLNPGFQTPTNGVFSAIIKGCIE